MFSTKRKNYRDDFKLKIISEAGISSNREVGRLFSDDKKSVREWRKGKEKLEKMGRCKHSMQYHNPFWPELAENLCLWVKVQREAGNSASTIKIWLKAKKKKR